jgi:hypothetical protein
MPGAALLPPESGGQSSVDPQLAAKHLTFHCFAGRLD